DSARVQSAASGRARFAARDSNGKRAAGPGERRDFQGCDGTGDLRAANVRNLGANDFVVEGRAPESGPAVWRTRSAGQIRNRIHLVARRQGWSEFCVSTCKSALAAPHTAFEMIW